jgi:methylase of polypeptide subunit release factors
MYPMRSAGYDLVLCMHKNLYNKILTDLFKTNPEIAKKTGKILSYSLNLKKPPVIESFVENQIEFVECDMLPQSSLMENRFDLICANLPYIPTGKLHALPVYGREPTLALDGGEDGLDLFRGLLAVAPKQLAHGGRMLLEIEATRGPAALSVACDLLEEADIHLYRDLSQQDRLLDIRLPGK